MNCISIYIAIGIFDISGMYDQSLGVLSVEGTFSVADNQAMQLFDPSFDYAGTCVRSDGFRGGGFSTGMCGMGKTPKDWSYISGISKIHGGSPRVCAE